MTGILRIIYTAWLLGVENIIVAGNHIHVEEYHYLVVAVQMSPSSQSKIIKLSDQYTSMFELRGITALVEQSFIHSRKVIVV